MYRSMGLRFPRLDFVRDVEFTHANRQAGKTVALFRLDWSEKDRFHEEHWTKWKALSCPDIKLEFAGKFPEEYETLLQGARFAIPQNYLNEIHRMTQMAVTEWNTERSFDTVIREMCLEPAQKFVECSFELIGDCIYDASTNYYKRGAQKHIITSLMLYRFWQYQTGRGLLEERAQFDWLEKLRERAGKEQLNARQCAGDLVKDKQGVRDVQRFNENVSTCYDITKYLRAMRDYAKVLDAAYSTAVPGPVVWESVKSEEQDAIPVNEK